MDKLKEVYEVFTDLWRLYKKYHGITNNEPDKWDALLRDAADIQIKHKQTRLIRGCMMALLETLEDEAKETDDVQNR